MVHELILHPRGELPSFEELADAVRDDEALGPKVLEDASSPELLVLADADLGAHVILGPGAPELDEDEALDEDAPLPLLLQLPYARPSAFAAWGASIARQLAARFDLRVAEPGAAASEDLDEAAIRKRWEDGQRAWIDGLKAGEAPPAELPREVPRALLDTVLGHNARLTALREAAGPRTTVPRLLLAAIPARKEPAVVARVVAGEPFWLPAAATHVVLVRRKKALLGTKEEEVLVEADLVRALAAPAGEGPAGVPAFGGGPPGADAAWHALSATPARGLALHGWEGIVDAAP